MAHPLASRWQTLFWRGAIALAFAVTAFAWPIVTLTSLFVLFGLFALVDGALALAVAVRREPHARWSWALLAEGLAGLGAGTLALLLPGRGPRAIGVLIAAWAISTGALEVYAALALERGGATSAGLLAGGFASLALGGALLAWPPVATTALAWGLGAYALAFGAVLVALALRLRNLRHDTTHPRGPMAFGGGAR